MTLFAVTASEAIPDPFVVAVVPFGKVTPAPEAAPLNVTVTPLSKFPLESFTTTLSEVAKAVFTVAVWLLPPVTAITPGFPGRLVRAKEADAEAAVALTL